MITIREMEDRDLSEACAVWNEVVEDGVAFPQMDLLDEESGKTFFAGQSLSAVAEDDSGEILGLYILHPNNVGRCGHICNCSYAVRKASRGRHIGELLVRDSLEQGKRLGFRILQFNAVVAANHIAIHLYEKLGFVRLGTIPGGFLMKNGRYEDIIPFYHEL